MPRLLPIPLIIPALLAVASLHAADSRDLESVVKPFFTEHCTSCHGEKKQKGDLRVDTLKIDFESPKTMAHWEEIMNRINSGDMPPDDEKRPKPGDVSRVAEWIVGQLREAEVAMQNSGRERVAFRKLSREEYANTIRDLLGVNFDVTAPRACRKTRTGTASSASARCSRSRRRMWRSISRRRTRFSTKRSRSARSRSAR